MKLFKQYIFEQEMIVPAVSRIPEPLPFGFSIKGDPVGKKKPVVKPQQQLQQTKPLTFAERLRLAKERANKSNIKEQTEIVPLFHSFFVSKSGKIIEPTSNPLYANKEVIDHAYIPATQAHDFNMRDAEMHDLLELSDEEVLNYHKHGKGFLNASADRRLSSRGFIKGTRHTTERNINLQATTSNARDSYHIDDMSEIITSLRSRLSEHPDWVINIDGLKTHEPEELESMKHRLSPAHIEQLTQPGKQFKLVNTDEIDRFIHGRGSLSRNPGSGVHSVPSPEEMRRKAGRTDEPESIQRGRFFQSDSYCHMKTFSQYIAEVVSYDKNTLFAIGPSGNIEFYHPKDSNPMEHQDAFKHLNFNDRPHGGETIFLGDFNDLSYAREMGYPGADRPRAVSWGRVDHENKVYHIVTNHGAMPPIEKRQKNKRSHENDIFDRLSALKHLKKHYPDYQVHHGHTYKWDKTKNREESAPRIISPEQYEKELINELKD